MELPILNRIHKFGAEIHNNFSDHFLQWKVSSIEDTNMTTKYQHNNL